MQKAICVVDRGTVRVEQANGTVLAEHSAGAVFGEMSFLENREASASVIAQTDTIIKIIDGMHVHGLCGITAFIYQT